MIKVGAFEAVVEDEAYLKELHDTYPELDIAREIKRMRIWLDANPRHRYKNYKRFIVNWLNKETRYGRRSALGKKRLEVRKKYANLGERDIKRDPGENSAQGDGPVALSPMRGDAIYKSAKPSRRSVHPLPH
jgi:hypothetical protein